jgi:hypothetical protein
VNRRIQLVLLLLLVGFALKSAGQGTAFSYQGRLNDTGAPANAAYDFRFALYDNVTNGNQLSLLLTNSAVAVSNGLFNVTLDFGPDVFTGENAWLEIAVRAAGRHQLHHACAAPAGVARALCHFRHRRKQPAGHPFGRATHRHRAFRPAGGKLSQSR